MLITNYDGEKYPYGLITTRILLTARTQSKNIDELPGLRNHLKTIYTVFDFALSRQCLLKSY